MARGAADERTAPSSPLGLPLRTVASHSHRTWPRTCPGRSRPGASVTCAHPPPRGGGGLPRALASSGLQKWAIGPSCSSYTHMGQNKLGRKEDEDEGCSVGGMNRGRSPRLLGKHLLCPTVTRSYSPGPARALPMGPATGQWSAQAISAGPTYPPNIQGQDLAAQSHPCTCHSIREGQVQAGQE